jgi:hypothetical protein
VVCVCVLSQKVGILEAGWARNCVMAAFLCECGVGEGGV